MNDEIALRVVMMTEGFQIDIADNVATLLGDAEAGMVRLRGQSAVQEIRLTQPIKTGHKVALCTLESGAAIVKYGVVIGEATRSIGVGEWVHLHNCRSRYDAQSSTLNIETGTREETPYV